MADVNMVAEGLVRMSAHGPILLGSRCRGCGETYFPQAHACTRCCATGLEIAELGDRGTLWSWTVQSFLPKPPYNGGEDAASFKPFGVGYVQMPCGVKVEARLTTADPQVLRVGLPMRLRLEPYRRTVEGQAIHTYAFAPAGDAP